MSRTFNWKSAAVIALGGLAFSCSSSQKQSDVALNSAPNKYIRDLASTRNPIPTLNPKTGKDFWQEFSEASGPALLKPKLKVFGTWVRANPVATFEALRKNAPVLELEALPLSEKPFAATPYKTTGTIVLSRYEDVADVLSQPTKFSVRNYSSKMENSVGPFMLAYDGSQYNIKEKPWMRKMMPASDITRVRAIVRDLVNKAIADEKYVGQSVDGRYFARLELVNQIARKVPIQLSGEYFGFPGPSKDKMYEWSRATQADFFHNVRSIEAVRLGAITAGKEMHTYLKDLIKKKQAAIAAGQYNGRNDEELDVLTRLVKNNTTEFVAPRSAEDDRIRTNIMGTLVGGVETTQAAIVQSLNQLFMRPDVFEAARRAALAGDIKTVEKYVWEALRFHPVFPFVVRYAEEDMVLKSGAKIPKGYHVLASTHSAMFDETVPSFENSNEFNINRDQSKFFHLGYGHHRCLGDNVALVEVPEVVMALLKLPNLRPVSGQLGQLDFRKRTKSNALKADEYDSSFPEQFSVEYDATAAEKEAVEVVSEKYAYEDYLMDFDRDGFRQCLTGMAKSGSNLLSIYLKNRDVISENKKRHKLNWITQDNRELLFCRLKGDFRSCMNKSSKEQKFEILAPGAAHASAFSSCASQAGLSEMEKTFYRHVMLGETLNSSVIDASQSTRHSGPDYAFEDHIKFYDRYTYRECFMNPAGLKSFPNSRDMIFYTRLNIDFRMCMGKPVLLHDDVSSLLGADRWEQYEKCKNGVYNEKTFKYEGRLSKEEKYFYETMILKRQVRLEDMD